MFFEKNSLYFDKNSGEVSSSARNMRWVCARSGLLLSDTSVSGHKIWRAGKECTLQDFPDTFDGNSVGNFHKTDRGTLPFRTWPVAGGRK